MILMGRLYITQKKFSKLGYPIGTLRLICNNEKIDRDPASEKFPDSNKETIMQP